MVELLFSTYLDEMKKEKSLKKQIENLDKVSRILGIITLLGFLLMFISIFYIFLYGKYKFYIGSMIGTAISECLFLLLVNKKISREHVVRYHNSLDQIKKVLQMDEYKYYKEEKIKYIIRKCNRVIKEIEDNNKREKDDKKEYLELFIFPILTYMGVSLRDIVNQEKIIIGGILIIFLFFITKCYILILPKSEIKNIEERKAFVRKLEDLLYRDFRVEFMEEEKDVNT